MNTEITDTFQFSELIDGNEHKFLITPCDEGFRIDQNGSFKGRLITDGPGKRKLQGDIDPKSSEKIIGWIRARYDLN